MTRFGVNYTPREGWFHAWGDLDAARVRADFDQIADLGLDHVRVFPLWPLLQPNRTLISPRALDDVLTMVDQAGAAGLDVSVDGLNGHLSSYDFLPSWVSTWHGADLFTDPRVIEGERSLLQALATALRERPHVTGMTLGNEFAQFAKPSHPSASAVDVPGVDAWLRTMFAALTDAWPHGRHHHSFDDLVWFDDDVPFVPRHATTHGAATTVHSWVFVSLAPRLGAGHRHLAWFARFLCEVAAAWSPDPGRRIWLQEVGAPRPWIGDEAAADFLTTSVRTCAALPQVEAITWWCSHDVSRELADFPELEYSLGLFTSAGDRKPEAEALAAVVADLRADGEPAPAERPALVIGGDWHSGEGRSHTMDMFDAWSSLSEQTGRFPALVHERFCDDLAVRGISGLGA